MRSVAFQPSPILDEDEDEIDPTGEPPSLAGSAAGSPAPATRPSRIDRS